MVRQLKNSLVSLHAYQQVMFLHALVYVLLFIGSGALADNDSVSVVEYLGWSSNFKDFFKHPWTLLTHLCVHVSFAHFFLNLLMLYVLGKELEILVGKSGWWRTYLLSTIGGVLVYSISANLLEVHDRFLVGNSAANMGLVFSLVVIDYNRRINFWGVIILEMKWVALFFILLDVIGIRQGWNVGGSWAHFGGALVGALYWRRNRVEKRNTIQHKRPKSDDEFNSERVQKENELNAILDKINRSGYESLSKREKEFLNQQSQG